MQANGISTKGIELPRNVKMNSTNNQTVPVQKNGNGPTMKGMIGPTKNRFYINDNQLDTKKKKLF